MSKNIIFITAIKLQGQESKSEPYKFAINSFKQWADKYNCELFVLDQLLISNDKMKVNYNKYYCFDLLKNEGIDFDQILLVDADTIIHPECPNFFELTDHKYTLTRCDDNFDIICRSKENYEKFFNNGVSIYKVWDYFNSAFQIINKEHKDVIEGFIKFYWDNFDLVNILQENYCLGTDNPLLNYYIRTKNIELKFLPYQYCMINLNLKNVLNENMQYLQIPGIYKFNNIPKIEKYNMTYYWMEKTYKNLYGNDL